MKHTDLELVPIESLGFVRIPTEEIKKNRCQAKGVSV
jgi:hypothetical protein